MLRVLTMAVLVMVAGLVSAQTGSFVSTFAIPDGYTPIPPDWPGGTYDPCEVDPQVCKAIEEFADRIAVDDHDIIIANQSTILANQEMIIWMLCEINNVVQASTAVFDRCAIRFKGAFGLLMRGWKLGE